MATSETTNLQLVKYGAGTDNFIRTDYNGNLEKIDTFAGNTNEAIANVDNKLTFSQVTDLQVIEDSGHNILIIRGNYTGTGNYLQLINNGSTKQIQIAKSVSGSETVLCSFADANAVANKIVGLVGANAASITLPSIDSAIYHVCAGNASAYSDFILFDINGLQIKGVNNVGITNNGRTLTIPAWTRYLITY